MNPSATTAHASASSPPSRALVFQLAEESYAVDLTCVERVVPALAVRPLPDAPPGVAGVFNRTGQLVPLIDARVRLGLPARALGIEQQFVLVHTGRRTVALWVDRVVGVEILDGGMMLAARACLPEMPSLRGVLRLRAGLTLLYDLERFISADDECALTSLLEPLAVS